VVGDTAWVADKGRGVAVLDVSNPAAASFIVSVNTQDEALELAKSGDVLYVADRAAGLTIYNVADLGMIITLGGVALPDEAIDVALYEQYALVAAFEAGLRIVDVSDPGSAMEVTHVDLPGHAERVVVNGHWAYVALHDKGIAAIDITDPQNPIVMGYAETPGSAVDLVLNDLQIILADTYCLGFYEFNPTGIQPESPQILPGKFSLQAFPNPFNASTVLSFQLQVASFVKLEVFDINGRTVGARHAVPLQKGWYPSGTHQITFDALGLTSGIYLARLQAGSYQATEKLVLLK